MNPSEVSYSTHIAVYGDDNAKIKTCNIEPDTDVEGNDPEDIVWYIEDSMKRSWSTADKERKEMIEFLKEHEQEIITGNTEYELIQVNKKIDELTARKETLENRLAKARQKATQ
jgi:hypothetical protein